MKEKCSLVEAKTKLEQAKRNNDHIEIKVWTAIVRKIENEGKPPIQPDKARKKPKR
jgi:hypothetical protein